MALGTLGILGLATAAGGVAQGMAAKSAADSQAEAANNANDTERYIYDQNVALTEPAREIGNNALAALAFESGLGAAPTFGGTSPYQIQETYTPGAASESAYNPYAGPQGGGVYAGDGLNLGESRAAGTSGQGVTSYGVNGQTFGTRADAQSYLDGLPQQGGTQYQGVNLPDPNLDLSTESFEASPGYQFRLNEGNKALERMASARGMRFSGTAAKDAMRFAQGIGSEEYGNFVNRETDQFNRSYGVGQDKLNALRGLSGVGQTATQAQISAGNNYSSAYGQNSLAAGNAAAQGSIGVGNAITGGINSLSGLYGQAQSGYLGQNPGFGITPSFNPFAGVS